MPHRSLVPRQAGQGVGTTVRDRSGRLADDEQRRIVIANSEVLRDSTSREGAHSNAGEPSPETPAGAI
jgi:hypothetical protein